MARVTRGVNYNAPGKAHREGVMLLELASMFPDEETSRKWFEAQIWPNGERCCTLDRYAVKNQKMPYRCRDCRRYFSAKMGTALGGLEGDVPAVGVRDLHVSDKPEGRIEHEAPPRSRREPDHGLVHAPPPAPTKDELHAKYDVPSEAPGFEGATPQALAKALFRRVKKTETSE